MQENQNNDATINELKRKRFLELFIAILVGIGLGAILYYLISKRHKFLSNQNVDYEDCSRQMLAAIATIPRDLSPQNRLIIAHQYLLRGDPISRDISIFLGFTALETHIGEAIDSRKPGMSEQARGIVEKAAWYKDIQGINEEDRSKLKKYTVEIRNPLMHGQVYRGELAGEFLDFCDHIIYSKIAA